VNDAHRQTRGQDAAIPGRHDRRTFSEIYAGRDKPDLRQAVAVAGEDRAYAFVTYNNWNMAGGIGQQLHAR